MAESIVTDWINDFNALEPEELKSFAALHSDNHELSTAIHSVLNDRSKHQEYLHSICNQLYNFYRSNENELKYFTLQFFPNLIYLYLNGVACGEKQNFRYIETLLLCCYNIEVCSENGMLRSVSYRMPVLAQASIYHEEKNLHASDLKRWEEHSNKDISWGSLHQVSKITAQNRLTVMAALMFVFNQQLSLIPKSGFYHLCKNSSKLASQGFTKFGHSYRSSYGNDPMNTSISSASSVSSNAPKIITPRIPLSQKFILELLNANYFAMFNEFASVAIQAVDDIHTRACYELYSDVILVTNAIKNSLQANPTGQPSDGPMGISVALTPSTTTVTVSKSMITNASFRTKKLPDDLEIADLKHLQLTQDEMVKKFSATHEQQQQQLNFTDGDQQMSLLKPLKRLDGMSRKIGWRKGWNWKQSPVKSSSIEEEPVCLLESPKRSLQSSKSSTPNLSPKHNLKKIHSTETVSDDASGSALVRRKQRKSDSVVKSELRSSASARLLQYLESKDAIDKIDSDEFFSLIPDHGRPASIHVIQSVQNDDVL